MKARDVVIGAAVFAGVGALIFDRPAPRPAARIPMTEHMREAAAAAIRASGFRCPQAKLAIAEGLKPQGLTVKVYCGPDDPGAGIYPDLAYLLIVDGPMKGLARPVGEAPAR